MIRQRFWQWAGVGIATAACACGGSEPGGPAKQTAAPQKIDYPAPRYPSYMRPPSSKEELMVYARRLAQNRRGLQGAGFGVIEKGQRVLWVPSRAADQEVLDALKQAVEERGG